MLEILNNWLKIDPNLCNLSKESIRNYKNVHNESPYLGLVKWCIFAPIFWVLLSNPKLNKKKITDFDQEVFDDFEYFDSDVNLDLDSEKMIVNGDSLNSNDEFRAKSDDLLSQIHLSLLGYLHSLNNSAQCPLRFTCEQLIQIIDEVLLIIAKEKLPDNNPLLVTTLTRLSQFVQSIASMKLLDGNKVDLVIRLSNLPQNRYLVTLIKNL